MTENFQNTTHESEVKSIVAGEKAATTENPSKGMAWSTFFMFIFASLLGGLIGGVAGFYSALLAPVQNQVVVFDLDKVMADASEEASKGGQDPIAIADRYVKKAREMMKAQSDMGVIVIDKASVLDVPEHLVMRMPKPTEVTGSKSGSDADQLREQLKAMNEQLKLLQKQPNQQ